MELEGVPPGPDRRLATVVQPADHRRRIGLRPLRVDRRAPAADRRRRNAPGLPGGSLGSMLQANSSGKRGCRRLARWRFTFLPCLLPNSEKRKHPPGKRVAFPEARRSRSGVARNVNIHGSSPWYFPRRGLFQQASVQPSPGSRGPRLGPRASSRASVSGWCHPERYLASRGRRPDLRSRSNSRARRSPEKFVLQRTLNFLASALSKAGSATSISAGEPNSS